MPKLSVAFVWYDFWIGLYYNVERRALYICPLPMLVIRLEFQGGDECLST